MSRARDFADLAGSADAGGLTGRNLIINGAMQVAQRGTSFTSQSAYTLDRFRPSVEGTTDQLAFTISQDSTSPDGFANSLKYTTTTAETAIDADEAFAIRTAIEAQDLQRLGYGASGAQKVTMSFYVRSSVTGTYGVNIRSLDPGRQITGTYTINSADTWEHKTITFVGDTSGAINDDNGEGFRIHWHLAAGSNFTSSDSTSWGAYANAGYAYGHAQNGVLTTLNATWYITGVQLEVGEQATPFEHRSYGDELARCQRYYTRFQWSGNFDSIGSGLIKSNGNEARIIVPLPVSLRANPTASFTGTGLTVYDAASFDTSTTLQNTYSGRHSLMIDVNVNGLTANRPATLHVENSSSAFNLDAEL